LLKDLVNSTKVRKLGASKFLILKKVPLAKFFY
jgi:hypothetical protein